MALVPTFSAKDIREKLEKEVAKFEQKIILNLNYLGEKCRTHAILNRGYKDQTGNLKSSTGYVVVVNGKVVTTKFEKALPTALKGVLAGKNLAYEVSKKFPTGFVLIVVAGMNYATKVEKMGKNVLKNTEAYAKAELPQLLKSLKLNVQ